LQHAGYAAQLALKRDMLAETLARLGGLTDLDVPALVPSPEPFGYRSRARFAVTRPKSGPASLAYYQAESHRLVPIPECPVLAPRLNEAVAHLNHLLAVSESRSLALQEVRLGVSATTGEVVIRYTAEHGTRALAEAWFAQVRTGVAWVKGQALTAGRGFQTCRWVEGDTTLTERLAGLTFRVSDRAFVQANWKLNETLVEAVTSWALNGAAPLPLRVLELYAGIGNLGLPIARAGALVTLMEGNPAALADARYSARVNHVGRCRFRSGPVEAFLAACAPGEYDLVLLDPPRSGLSKEALAGLLRLKPGRILYLSCDPPTLARDLRAVGEAGYRVTRLQGYDMFPQTMHIETLVELAN
jgi:23S rRNA (uracil1939-C5)-methyltransferase